jgi:serine kinase of HPr protein (carbohydrate metabolism regulator)
MNSDFSSFKIRRTFFNCGLPMLNIDSILEVPIESELLPMSELESIAEISEETLNSTIENWKRIAKDTDFEEILNAEID